ncbi:VOC family protein [Methylobacterium nonmethylotrophicum]|uniref:Glyoxalase n=1 Tax=Methylobacterium nonmethylotrophicum TaxID=1141884 RepID=A0A4Z0NQ06_9HYPH|nr:VOC family protein [Methylobacterium nonmethylotrophicum]TGD98378.1 glyoxalase [Methylobacterium nonmethylotrophicum]
MSAAPVSASPAGALRLARVVLVAAEPDRLAGFYRDALGFADAEAPPDPASAGLPVTRTVPLRLGDQRLDLVAVSPAGRPYPGDVPGFIPLFQHCAIIVSDMAAAHARLSARPGWRPISTDGPVRLPDSSGGVTAFKFRDPEGHPLEFLAFPPDATPTAWRRPDAGTPCLGLDHSAISVADTARSVAFYESLGLRVASRSLNTGPEQARLDAVADPTVEVTGLGFPDGHPPHVELLCYRGDYPRAASDLAANDVAATRLVLEMADGAALRAACAAHAGRIVSRPVPRPDGGADALLRDPDGHLVWLTAGYRVGARQAAGGMTMRGFPPLPAGGERAASPSRWCGKPAGRG